MNIHPEERIPPQAVTDRRGLRLSAAFTLLTLMAVLLALLSGARFLAWVLLGWQAGVMHLGTRYGPEHSPYYPLILRILKGRGAGPTDLVAAARFSQLCGLIVLLSAAVAFALGATGLGVALLVVLMGLSALLAVFDICLGCRLYGLLGRLGLLR